MYISDKIMIKVEAKEEENKNFRRCIDTKICPRCGGDLKGVNIGGENLIEIKYTCNNCPFTHKRIEC